MEKIEFHDAFAVGGIGELEIEHLGVILGLLESGGEGLVEGLGLDDRQHGAGLVPQKVVRALGGMPPNLGPRDHDAAIGEGALLENLLVGPTRGVQLGHDEFPASVGFGDHGGMRFPILPAEIDL